MKFTISAVLAFSLSLVLAAENITLPACPVTNVTAPPLDPVTQAWLDAGGGNSQSLFSMPIAQARAAFDFVQGNVSHPDIDIKVLSLPVGPTGNVTVYFYEPKSDHRKKGKDLLPVVVFLHGGGYVVGGPKSYERLVVDLVRESGAAVFFVDYALSPEVRYPVPIEQTYAAIQWLLEHGEKLGVDPKKMGIAGDSAGGHLSASVTLLGVKRKTPLPKLQVLFYPGTDFSCRSVTEREFARGPGLSTESVNDLASVFLPDAKSRLEDIASPLLASDEDLAKFPETLTIVAEVDPLRQEGEDFGTRLQGLGVRSTTIRFLGTIHGFVTINALAETPAAKSAVELAGYKLKKALC